MGRSSSGRNLDLETLAAQGKYKLTNVAALEHFSTRHMRRRLQGLEENPQEKKGVHERFAEFRLKQMRALRHQGKSYKEIGTIVELRPSYVSTLLKQAASLPDPASANGTAPP